ncbi:MAG: N-acetyltransferase [Bacteroidia bacterium]|nr:MAG: N-acetyltransferase [Bacteroidia bacterium]
MKITEQIALRREVLPGDPGTITTIVTSTGFFREDEILVAAELAEEGLQKGKASGYEFLFVEIAGETVAYSCYGLIPCTLHSYDLYWIATHRDHMNQGIGKYLLQETEKAIFTLGGKGIYVETSSKEQYAPTRAFYEKNQYLLKARFEDFYAPDDHKLVYVKTSKGHDMVIQ